MSGTTALENPYRRDDYYQVLRARRHQKAMRRYLRLRAVCEAAARKYAEGTCTCGQHRGITLEAEDGEVIAEHICPVSYFLVAARTVLKEKGGEALRDFIDNGGKEKFEQLMQACRKEQ